MRIYNGKKENGTRCFSVDEGGRKYFYMKLVLFSGRILCYTKEKRTEEKGMSIDLLQEKIRKLKCPILVDLAVNGEHIPAHISAGHSQTEAYELFCRELMVALKGTVPGVRFSFDQMALMGGLENLSRLMRDAVEMGFYTILDAPAVSTPWAAERAAKLLEEGSAYPCHCLIVDPYIGSDAIRPFLTACKSGKAVFFAVRSPNKSAVELQDLMTGSRLVHVAAADLVNRHGESIFGKSGYSQLGVLTAATNANAVMGLRAKYKRMFLLVDGLDYPGGNGKICSYGFDQFGHGCAISVGPAIAAAWKEEASEGFDFAPSAVRAAERIRNNLSRYFTIL